jgi:hypothetical protein
MVRDDAGAQRFELVVGDTVPGFATYRVRDGAYVVLHTEIDPAYRGQGLGLRLARGTLDLLRGRGQQIVPVCPFFVSYLRKHPEDADLVRSS